MIDRDHVGQAGLAALEWLDDTERAEFDHECLINPDLRRTSAELRDLIAAVAATAPPVDPPPHTLAAIFARLATPVQPAARARASAGLPWSTQRVLPWAVAAGFAVLAGWMGLRSQETARHGRPGGPGSPDTAEPAVNGTGPHTTAGSPKNPAGTTSGHDGAVNRPSPGNAPAHFFSNRTGDFEPRLHQDTERLRTEVSKLRAAEEARHQLPSGVSDLRVVEMLPPGTKRAPEKNELLSTRVAEAIAGGLQAPTKTGPAPDSTATPAAPQPIQLRGHGASPDADIELVGDNLINIGALNLHPDAQVVHKDFPPPEDYARLGLTPLDENTVYDGNGGVYHRSANGREWILQKAPPSFTPPDPGEPASGPVPPLRPKPAPAETPGADGTPAPNPGVPYALPVLDEQGRGTLIVQDLPPAPDGQLYYLWMTDPRLSGPINVGVLPPIESAYDHFGFDLGTPGFVPNGYVLTLENADAGTPPTTPGKSVILQGP